MATRGEWTKYINTLHELALVEDDLRTVWATYNDPGYFVAETILFERFGVDV